MSTERGNLYRQMLETIRVLQPVAFLAENVKNILSPMLVDENNIKAIDRIRSDFEGLGYQ